MTTDTKAPSSLYDTAEGMRLLDAAHGDWRLWGPYVSDRQWGTVREDYSENGNAWDYFPHDHARSRAYRWGEDGIAGFSDDKQYWNLSLALWNGNDPILKERYFGLTNEEGNHGEDVKELYFYTDATPTHSYLRMLYKYPQAAFPYDALLRENRARGKDKGEYEVLDTGVFDEARYFDATVEYAKATADDILLRITVTNRAAAPATLHLLPQLWARNIWSWDVGAPKPQLQRREKNRVHAQHPFLPPMMLEADAPVRWLFCENETNFNRLFGQSHPGPFKDGINDFLIHGDAKAVRDDAGTKAAALLVQDFAPGETKVLRLRFRPEAETAPTFQDFDATMAQRLAEADAFYAVLQSRIADADQRLVQRQALAGLIWSKQFYHYDVKRWLDGDPTQPPPPHARKSGRNADWQHVYNEDIISMPDKWEYPWFASWDLGFHAVAFALIDTAFAKNQISLLLQDRYMHPSGQIPAYEWAFGDANPPVQAWAVWRIFEMDKALNGKPDDAFLRRAYNKLLLNFGWWVNRKDARGLNIFQGGFLGLDNIEIFDRSAPLPTGGMIDQVDGTSWMASFALFMMRIALELAERDPEYQYIAIKFFEHYLYIVAAVRGVGAADTLWDPQDSFFYDVLRLPDGEAVPLRVHSIVGLSPLLAVQVLEPELMAKMPVFAERITWFLKHRPDLAELVSYWNEPGKGERRLLSMLRGHRTKCLLRRMLDENEFLSEHGIRSVSKFHEANPFVYRFDGKAADVHYLPAESDTAQFGGNSNWRGPVWMPINYLFVEALYEFQRYYGESFVVEAPTGSGRYVSLSHVADVLGQRLASLSLKGKDGKRPVMGAYPLLQADPRSDQLVLLHEYYHGDNGRGVGASHQTGWSAVVALLLQPRLEQSQANVPVSKD